MRCSRYNPNASKGGGPGNEPNPLNEFVGGVGDGLYDVGEGAVAEAHAALTANPPTTVRNAGREIAGMIDAAIAAEDTPVSRAASAVANASARDIGRATGKIAGNVALASAPGAALYKAAALRQLRITRPRTTFNPPQIGWVKEATKSSAHAKSVQIMPMPFHARRRNNE